MRGVSAFGVRLLLVVSIVTACSERAAPAEQAIPDPDLTTMELPVRRAIAEARRSLVGSPQSHEAWGRYGGVLDAHGLDGPAATCYRRAGDLAPGEFRWPYLLAIVLEEQGAPIERIVALYERAAQNDSSFAPLHYRIGEARSRQGRLEAARDDYLRALELEPDLAVAHRGAGQVMLLLDEVERAIVHLERAEALAPGDRRVATALARAYGRRGDGARAAAMADRAKTLGDALTLPDPVRFEIQNLRATSAAVRMRADAAIARGDLDAALIDLDLLLESEPDDAWAHLQMGLIELSRGRTSEAHRWLARAVELSPQSPRTRLSLASCLLAMGRVPEAVDQARRATELGPESQLAHVTLATTLASGGDARGALRSFERAAALGPLDARAHANWGMALLQSGDLGGAIQHLRQAVTVSPQYARGHYQLGLALERAGDTSGAVTAYRTAVSIDASSPAQQRLEALGQR